MTEIGKTPSFRRRSMAEFYALSAVPKVASAPKAKPLRIAGAKETVRTKTGVEWLRDKGKLSHREAAFGIRYGCWWRGANIEGAQPIKSCLESDLPKGGGGAILTVAHDDAAWIADCRTRIARTHGVLQGMILRSDSYLLADTDYSVDEDPGIAMVAAVAAICGKGMLVTDIPAITPREVYTVETTLKNALGLLVSFERNNGPI